MRRLRNTVVYAKKGFIGERISWWKSKKVPQWSMGKSLLKKDDSKRVINNLTKLNNKTNFVRIISNWIVTDKRREVELKTLCIEDEDESTEFYLFDQNSLGFKATRFTKKSLFLPLDSMMFNNSKLIYLLSSIRIDNPARTTKKQYCCKLRYD